MSRATPELQDFAGRLIACEAEKNKSSRTLTPAAFSACESMRPPLAALVGSAGSRTILARVLVLAGAEVPWLHPVKVRADGSLGRADKREAQADPEEAAAGGVILVAHLLGLLTTFIGRDLTLRLVRETWPELSPGDPGSDQEINAKGGKNEKTSQRG